VDVKPVLPKRHRKIFITIAHTHLKFSMAESIQETETQNMEMREKNLKLIEIEHRTLLLREVKASKIKALEVSKQGFLIKEARDRPGFNLASLLKLESESK
jgi:Fe-S cluster biosynthesis and repair protein YggX